MCARFQTPAPAAAKRYWKLTDPLWRYGQSWRVLPNQSVPVVLTLDGKRTGRMMRWGLLPVSAESDEPLINAPVEKLETTYPWSAPWQRGQRCVISMAGFYEPHIFENGRKEPFYVHVIDRPIFGVAALWDRKKAANSAENVFCALITIPPNELLASVHNEKPRMPAVLREEDHETWLNGNPDEAKAVLQPYPSDQMSAWQVSRRLYATRMPDDASLIEPVSQAT